MVTQSLTEFDDCICLSHANDLYDESSGVSITKKLANHDTSILIDLDDSKHQ